MPWWAIAYAASYSLLSVTADAILYKSHHRFYWLVESVLHLTVGLLFVGYWVPIIPSTLGWLGQVAFVVAVLWEYWTGIQDFLEGIRKEESTPARAAGELAITLLLIGPAYIVAGLAVFS